MEIHQGIATKKDRIISFFCFEYLIQLSLEWTSDKNSFRTFKKLGFHSMWLNININSAKNEKPKYETSYNWMNISWVPDFLNCRELMIQIPFFSFPRFSRETNRKLSTVKSLKFRKCNNGDYDCLNWDYP